MKKIEFEKLSEFEIECLAFDKSIKYLSYKARTEKEMKNFLYENKFWKIVVEKTINKLKNYNYINDKLYILDYLNLRKNSKGYKKLAYELKNKGIDENLIEECLENFDSQKEIIEHFAQKFIKNREKNQKLKEKLFRHLIAKGFNYQEIQEVVRSLDYENWN